MDSWDPQELVCNWDLFPSNMIKYSTSTWSMSLLNVCVHPYSFCTLRRAVKACTGPERVRCHHSQYRDTEWRRPAVFMLTCYLKQSKREAGYTESNIDFMWLENRDHKHRNIKLERSGEKTTDSEESLKSSASVQHQTSDELMFDRSADRIAPSSSSHHHHHITSSPSRSTGDVGQKISSDKCDFKP